MASTVIVPIMGRYPTPFNYDRVGKKRKDLKEALKKAKNSGFLGMVHEKSYMNLNDVNLRERTPLTQDERKLLATSNNIVDYIKAREINSFSRRQFKPKSILRSYLSRNFIEDYEITLGPDVNAVFSSTWIDNTSVLMGTSCQKILKYNTKDKELSVVRSLGMVDREQDPVDGPIYMMVTNPSRTLVATGGLSPKNVAIYTIPDMKPFTTGVRGHASWLSDGAWMNDEVLVTVGSDCKAYLWRMNQDDRNDIVRPSASWEYERKNAVITGVAYSKFLGHSACLSNSGVLNILDMENFIRIHKCRLPSRKDVTCIISNETGTMYVAGGYKCALLIDARIYKTVRKIKIPEVRSLTMVDDLVILGTANGYLEVYDMTAGKYLWSDMFPENCVRFRMGLGYEYFPYEIECGRIIPSVNTHCFDPSYTRIFTAGGPPEVGTYYENETFGNFAAIWK